MKHRNEARQNGAHLTALHNRVEHPMREEKLRALKIGGKILAGGLLGYPSSGEPDQSAGF
jgi:hypothetical protein